MQLIENLLIMLVTTKITISVNVRLQENHPLLLTFT